MHKIGIEQNQVGEDIKIVFHNIERSSIMSSEYILENDAIRVHNM